MMQANHTIKRVARIDGAKNAHGNPTVTWADPVDVAIFAIYNSTSEQVETAREASIDELTVLLPSGSGFTSRDRAIVAGETYEVKGGLESFGTGPFSYAPGDRLYLQRVRG